MENKINNPTNRIKNLIILCSLITIIIAVSTYAWFIGMRTVNVSSFDVEIASTDSLLLSLNGKSWGSTVTISKDTLDDVSYNGHTNFWGGKGLIPLSTVGKMDFNASRMMLYEKASLTTTPGGYRLLASRVNNGDASVSEQDGYVAFDLFVKNFSGAQYIKELNALDEEAIYLTVDSEVTIASLGVEDTGIENSVRVAFTQIGRVAGTTTTETTITGINCVPATGSDVTGICREGQIWEPNDTNHVKNAISWYETSCIKRTGASVTSTDSYSGKCGTVVDGLAYPTYAVSRGILSSDSIDIYDGPAYNSYVPVNPLVSPLVAYPYFTDTMKLLKGKQRPTFMTLAPNSITKLRIYIYIEGQDIDNYDFASIGKRIAVKFGFTKERYTEEDINYDGPILNEGDGPNAADKTAPVITLKGDEPTIINLGGTYNEVGATAADNVGVVGEISITGTVNTSVAGTYKVTYKAKDAEGNIGTKTRTVIVQAQQ